MSTSTLLLSNHPIKYLFIMKWYRRLHYYEGRAYFYDFIAPDMDAALRIAKQRFFPTAIIGELAD